MSSSQLKKEIEGLPLLDVLFLGQQEGWLAKARDNQVLPIDGWNVAVARAGRGWGKRIASTTPLPTPTGWTLMGDLAVGDRLFDESGRVCRVTAIYDGTPERAYRLHFSDGTSIDADAEHLWTTWQHRDRKQFLRRGGGTHFPPEWPAWVDYGLGIAEPFGPAVRTTQDIIDTFTHSTRGDLNHCIPVALPLQLPEADLPLDPWLLGYWLGNGSVATPTLTAGSHRGEMDGDHVAARLEALGVEYTRRDLPEKGQASFYLRKSTFTLPESKTIPAAYLRASHRQRLELLRGLMDSDGSATPSKVEFCSMDEGLARAVLELVRTLGERPTLMSGRATLNGVDYGVKWRLFWRPSVDNPFSLPRKARAVPFVGKQGLRLRHRMIVDYEVIDPVPMRCITVDSRHRLFLCGEGMIPTHNTEVGANWAVRETHLYPGIVFHAVAPSHADLIGTMFNGISGIMSVCPPELIAGTNFSAAIPTIQFKNGSLIRGFSAQSPERLRGPQSSRVWGDEVAAWREGAEATLTNIDMSTRIAYRTSDGRLVQPQKLYTTTPKPLMWLKNLIDKAQIVINGSTYENKDNLAEDFLQDIRQYEGTNIGRQEIHGELIDISEAAIIKQSWLRIWPNERPLPWFEFIIVAMDTAFTERTFDKKTFDRDPTCCQVWGVFTFEGRWNIMLLERWSDQVGFPELVRRAKREMFERTYGRRSETLFTPLIGPSMHAEQVKRPDLLLIEDKGSGISLRQMLVPEGIEAWPYNPGKADKLSRLHAVSHVASGGPDADGTFRGGRGRIWLPESTNPKKKGQPRNWVLPMLDEVCIYSGPGTTKHDDDVDTFSMTMRYFADHYLGTGMEGKMKPGTAVVNVSRELLGPEFVEGEDNLPGMSYSEDTVNPYYG